MGEYLALVDGAGLGPTVVSEFRSDSGGFPSQRDDISYGIGRIGDLVVLVHPASSAKTFVPSQEVPSWQGGGPFDDAAWSDARAAVGFDLETGGDPDSFVRLHSYDADSATSAASWSDESGGNSWNVSGASLIEVESPNTAITKAFELASIGPGVGGDTNPFPAGDLTYELWVRPGELDEAHQLIFETGGGQNGTSILMTESSVRLLNSSGNTRTMDISVPLESIDTSDFVQVTAVLDSANGNIDLVVRGSAGGIASNSAAGTVGRGGNRASLFTWGGGGASLGNDADVAGGTFNLGGRTESTVAGVTPARIDTIPWPNRSHECVQWRSFFG